MLDLIYPPDWVKENWFTRLSLIGEGKAETKIVKLDKEAKEVAEEYIKQSKENPFNAYLRPGVRDAEGKILGSTAVWLDIDVQKHNLEMAAVKSEIENITPSPSLIIWSGRGFHVYWLLSSFCSDISRLKRITAGLAEKFSKNTLKAIDMQIVNQGVDSGARLVGSNNWKNGFPIQVSILSQNKSRYKLEDFPEKIEKGAKATNSGSQLVVRQVKDLYLHYFPDLDTSKNQHCVSCPFHEDNNPSMSLELTEGKWQCRSDSHTGPKLGGPILFYSLMEGKSIAEAKKDLKAISTSSDKDSLRDQLTSILESTFLPLYRCNDHVIGIYKPTQELIDIDASANEASFITDLAYALGGSPTQIIEEHIPADVLGMVPLNSVLRDIVLNILVKLPKDKQFNIIASGVHHIKTHKGWKSFLVDGEDFYEANNKKQIWVKQQLEGPAYGEIIPKFGNNNFYPFYEKEMGPVPTPKELWDQTFPILRDSWSWTEPADPYLLTLYLFYVWYHHWFGRPVEVFLCGDTSSGKSSLSEGLFAGTRDGSFGLISSALTFKATTPAGFYQEAANQSKLLVLDEIYDSKEPAARQMMEILRNMDAKDFAVKRGTAHGKATEYKIRMPVLWSAIKGPELEQDLNRKIMIYLKPKAGQQDPWDRIWLNYTEKDFEKIRASLPIFLLPYQNELSEAREEIIDSFLRSGKIPWRKGQMLMPLLQIAKVCGLDVSELANLLTERSIIEAEQMAREKPDRELMSFLLDYKFAEGESDILTSLAKRITNKYDLSEPNLGIYYRKDEHKLYLQGPQLVNNLLGKYANFKDINSRRLAAMLRPRPFYDDAKTVYLGADYGRRHVLILDVEKLLKALDIDLEKDNEMREMGMLS